MKRYLIAFALALGIVVASVATAQPSTEDSTTTMTFQDFKPRYQYRKDRWHAVKVRLCRSHAVPHRWPSANEVAPAWRDNRLNRLHRRIAYALSRGSACIASWPVLGKSLAAKLYGWTGYQWDALYALWNAESGWDPYKWNYGGSGACGIPQFLPCRYYGDGEKQIVAGLAYIADRYGSPANAYAHFRSANWY